MSCHRSSVLLARVLSRHLMTTPATRQKHLTAATTLVSKFSTLTGAVPGPRCQAAAVAGQGYAGAHSAARRSQDIGSWNSDFSLPPAPSSSSSSPAAAAAAVAIKLPSPVSPTSGRLDSSQSIPQNSFSPSDVGVSSQCGRRATNEDRTVVCELEPGLVLLGIFDGHGGSEAVDYVVRCLPASISYWLHREGSGGLQADLGRVLRRAFHDVNAGFTDLLFDRQRSTSTRVDDISVDVTSRRLRHCGTTATVCLLRQTTSDSRSTTQDVTELTVGHVGDTRAFLGTSDDGKPGKDSLVRQLTDDHRPGLPGETERIVSCDGHVTQPGGSHGASARVNGILEMTRSIGDVALKRYGVTAEPAIYTTTLETDRDSFLALVTDGVHSSMSTEQLAALVADCAESSEAARSIVETAILAGSRDNCTALVLPLGAWSQTRREAVVAPRVISFSDGRTAFGDLGLGFQF